MKPVSRVAAIMTAAIYFTPVYSLSALADDGVDIASGGTVEVTGPNGVCYTVHNPAGANMYVDDHTSGEWVNFYTYPDSASLSACSGGDTGGGGGGGGG
jgi:hypothetical protein